MDAFKSLTAVSFLRIVRNRYSLLFLGLYLYTAIIAGRGGLDTGSLSWFWIELFFLLYFYSYFYLILKPGRWRAILAAMPILISYLIQDAYFLVYGKVLRLIELLELPELLQVISFNYIILIAVFIFLPIIVFVARINYNNLRPLLLGAVPLMSLTILIVISPTAYTDFVHLAGNGVVKYSDAASVENNGRFTMLAYTEAARLHSLAMTEPYRNRAEFEDTINARSEELKQSNNRRNVHMIVLESFLDPRLFQRARFNRNPAHPAFEKLFGKKAGLSRSPVFGGATAQAEFEVLCGVPALEMLSSVEFNIFTGSSVFCLPGMLDKMGYRSIASNAYKPNFFNALPAYKGIGFSEIHFPQEYTETGDSYISTGDVLEEKYMFDEVLFKQNLAYVEKTLKENNKTPIFNYVMTIYGHTPHMLDPKLRPEIVTVNSDYADDHLQRAANQFYYRTKAIAEYVNQLIKLDKNSLIILISDHVPPLRNGPNTYRALKYVGNIKNSYYYNPLMIIENGRALKLKKIRHFDLPDVVYNYITDGAYCRKGSCEYLESRPLPDRRSYIDEYYLLMAHASE